MKRVKKQGWLSHWLLPAFLLVFTACESDFQREERGNGRVDIVPTTDNTITGAAISRATTTIEPSEVPSVNDLSLVISNSATKEVVGEWAKFQDFDPTEVFPLGDYEALISYGQLEEEGFAKPYYEGKATFKVKNHEVTRVDITAKLANARVKFFFSEEFKNYFAGGYHALINNLQYPAEEERAIYVKPGVVNVAAVVKRTAESEASVFSVKQGYTLKPCTEYQISLDVDAGAQILHVVYDDSTGEPVEVLCSISDEALSVDPPELLTEGFVSDESFNHSEGKAVNENYRIVVKAHKRIGKTTLITQSKTLLAAGWPESVELTNVSATDAAVLKNFGLEYKGFDANREKMAYVDFSKVLPFLRLGDTDAESLHVFTLSAADDMGKVNHTPVVLKAQVVDNGFAWGSELPETMAYMGDKVTLPIELDGNPKDVKFFANVTGTWKEMTFISADSQETSHWVTLGLKDIPTDKSASVKIKAEMCGHEIETQLGLKLVYFGTIDHLIYSNRLTVEVQDAEGNALDASKAVGTVAQIQQAGGAWTTPTQTLVGNKLTIKGLEAETTYNVRIAQVPNNRLLAQSDSQEVTTEAAQPLPNGDFEDLATTISYNNLNQGGPWSDLTHWTQQQTRVNVSVSEPVGWASVNAKTFNTNASTKNTWFMVPSTYSVEANGGHAMVIRNVAWDLKGTAPTRQTNTNIHPYNSKAPSKIANRSAGKLFLGSYSYASDGTETYNQGVSFTSRPVAIKGLYKYVRDAQNETETGTLQIVLLNGEVEVADAMIDFDATTGFEEFRLVLNYYTEEVRPTELKIMIASSNYASFDQSEETTSIKTTNRATQTEQLSRGAELTIDNLEFEY